MSALNNLDRLSLAVVIAGALNLGLRGLEGVSGRTLEPAGIIAEANEPAAQALLLAVGLAGLYQAYFGYRLYVD